MTRGKIEIEAWRFLNDKDVKPVIPDQEQRDRLKVMIANLMEVWYCKGYIEANNKYDDKNKR